MIAARTLNVRDICLIYNLPPQLMGTEHDTWRNRLWWRFRWTRRVWWRNRESDD